MTREELNDTLLKAAMKARYEKAFDIIKGEQVDSIKLTQIMIDAILEALPITFLDADAEPVEGDVGVDKYGYFARWGYNRFCYKSWCEQDEFNSFIDETAKIIQRAGQPVYQFDKEISK